MHMMRLAKHLQERPLAAVGFWVLLVALTISASAHTRSWASAAEQIEAAQSTRSSPDPRAAPRLLPRAAVIQDTLPQRKNRTLESGAKCAVATRDRPLIPADGTQARPTEKRTSALIAQPRRFYARAPPERTRQ